MQNIGILGVSSRCIYKLRYFARVALTVVSVVYETIKRYGKKEKRATVA